MGGFHRRPLRLTLMSRSALASYSKKDIPLEGTTADSHWLPLHLLSSPSRIAPLLNPSNEARLLLGVTPQTGPSGEAGVASSSPRSVASSQTGNPSQSMLLGPHASIYLRTAPL